MLFMSLWYCSGEHSHQVWGISNEAPKVLGEEAVWNMISTGMADSRPRTKNDTNYSPVENWLFVMEPCIKTCMYAMFYWFLCESLESKDHKSQVCQALGENFYLIDENPRWWPAHILKSYLGP